MQDNGDEKQIPQSESRNLSQNSEQQGTSKNLLQNLALELMHLIKEVNKTEITPKSVNAACQAASEIHKLLRLNMEMQKDRG